MAAVSERCDGSARVGVLRDASATVRVQPEEPIFSVIYRQHVRSGLLIVPLFVPVVSHGSAYFAVGFEAPSAMYTPAVVDVASVRFLLEPSVAG